MTGVKRNREGQHGFSLAELMVVVAIVGLLGVVGTPGLLGMKAKSSVRSDARDVLSAFKKAQTEAVKRSQSVCILFNSDAGTAAAGAYTLFVDNGAGTNANNETLDPGEPVLGVQSLRPGNSFANIGFGGNPGYNSRGLPLNGNVGSVDIRSTTTPLAFTLSLSNAGFVKSKVK